MLPSFGKAGTAGPKRGTAVSGPRLVPPEWAAKSAAFPRGRSAQRLRFNCRPFPPLRLFPAYSMELSQK
ncbi:hypothetical protein SAMN05421736_10978 [Evansella caseinilytica]|uniref:Uncharacterized protein n=1 Tax=Evansella caseinilytica TaxID=1503961 RepID=A0A1H3RXR0_9BACI|nr:hypothetical protein SAMN05421736_10978 [Evansella caseinilytica]